MPRAKLCHSKLLLLYQRNKDVLKEVNLGSFGNCNRNNNHKLSAPHLLLQLQNLLFSDPLLESSPATFPFSCMFQAYGSSVHTSELSPSRLLFVCHQTKDLLCAQEFVHQRFRFETMKQVWLLSSHWKVAQVIAGRHCRLDSAYDQAERNYHFFQTSFQRPLTLECICQFMIIFQETSVYRSIR